MSNNKPRAPHPLRAALLARVTGEAAPATQTAPAAEQAESAPRRALIVNAPTPASQSVAEERASAPTQPAAAESTRAERVAPAAAESPVLVPMPTAAVAESLTAAVMPAASIADIPEPATAVPPRPTAAVRAATKERRGPSPSRALEAALAAYAREDYLDAARKLTTLAGAGDPEAQYRLGLLYARGKGVLGNLGDAVVWYRRAAGQGHPEAQYQLSLAL